MSRVYFALVALLAAMLVFAACQKQQQQAEEIAPVALTDEQVIQAIDDHIKASLDADGNYAIADEAEGRTRKLKLDYVHTSVHAMEDGSYYACADMLEDAARLDLDFYVVAEDGTPKVARAVIHKVDGESRK